jgi:translocation protein SEC62
MSSATSKISKEKVKADGEKQSKENKEKKESKETKSHKDHKESKKSNKEINKTPSDEDNISPEQYEKDEEIYRKLSTIIIKLEEKGLPVKEAAYGKTRAEYVRGDDLLKCFKENLTFICQEIKNITGEDINPSATDALQKVYEEFNGRNMMLKALKFKDDGKIKYPKRLAPYEEKLIVDDCCDKKHGSEDEHGQHVSQSEMRKFEEKMFYVLDIHRSKRSVYMWLTLVVVGILMYCLFPVWPVEVKIGVWWICYILLNLMVGIIVIRLVVYAFMYVFGVDFWVFPNLFDEKLGVLESFVPFVSFAKRTESMITLIVRACIFGFIAYLCWTVYDNPNTVNDFGQHVADLYVDFFEWGKEKVINYGVRNKNKGFISF